MSQQRESPQPAGGTTPVGGRDRTNDPQAEAPQQPGGGGAPGTGQEAQPMSEEARNQQATSQKSRAESGTP